MSTTPDPAVCATVAALHDAYERALLANDVETLQGFFWNSPETVRFGVAEQSFGAEAIAGYRRQAAAPPAGRTLLRRSVVAFGPEHASVMCEIASDAHAGAALIRQSQLWVRFPHLGWKIVSAHVSRAAASTGSWSDYAAQAAARLSLPLAADELPDIALHLERAAAIAGPLLAHPVPDHVERAAIFTA